MAVVINEFEVVPPPAAGSAEAARDKPAEKDEKPKLDLPELERLLRTCHERAARVRAH